MPRSLERTANLRRFAAFVKNLQNEKDKSILVVEDQGGNHIVEVRDLPAR
jgi:hypothetical protein